MPHARSSGSGLRATASASSRTTVPRREGAFEAKKLFEETFPDVKVYMGYENPYFKVSVGNCLTAEEAIILKGRVSATFPKAFLKNEEIAVSDLVEP